MLEINIAGLKLKTPLILASGILGVSSSVMNRLSKTGLGAVTTKSIGPHPRIGFKNPSIVEVQPGTFINSVGLGNPGIDNFIHEIKEFKKFNFPLIVSVFGHDDSTYIEVASKAENAGADAIEINISCPHSEVACIGIDKVLTHNLVLKMKEKISIPLFVKLNPNVTDIVEIALAAEQGGADALIAINTMEAMAINIDTRRPILSHGSGGLSGKAIHHIAIKKVYDLFKRVHIPIIGCGGISKWQDVIEFFLAGASAVQIGTFLYNGFEILKEINDGLVNYLNQNNLKSISE
ncbi:MAG: dihydroorotate dehydrogenase, partial [Promethearchaeota archaeon]